MSIFNNGVDVFFWLSWDSLSLSESNILDKTAFEVILEELPITVRQTNMAGRNWRNPYRSILSRLIQELKFLKPINIESLACFFNIGCKLNSVMFTDVVLKEIYMIDLALILQDGVFEEVAETIIVNEVKS